MWQEALSTYPQRAIRERDRRRERWAFTREYLLKHPCKKCGEAGPNVLDFHHVRGVKLFCIARAVSSGYAEETILEEMKKCVVLCANCHRRETAKKQGWIRMVLSKKRGGVLSAA